MIIYFFLLTGLLICCWLEYQGKDMTKLSVFFLVFMLLMCALRDQTVGTDTVRYLEFAESSDTQTRFGLFYEKLRNFGQLLGNSPHIYLMLLAILTYVPLIYITKKESVNPALTVLLYVIATPGFFLETFNISRQAMAIVYCLLSMIFMQNKKYKYSVLFSIIAIVLHQYTIIYFLFIWINWVKLSSKFVYLTLFFSMIIGITDITEYLNSFFMQLEYLSKLVTTADEFMSAFNSFSEREIMSENNLTDQLSRILPMIALCVLTYTKKDDLSFYYKCFFVGTIITNFFVTTSYGARLASSLSIALILSIPFALNKLNYQKKRPLVFLLFLIMLLYVRMIVLYNSFVTIDTPVPYHSILFK